MAAATSAASRSTAASLGAVRPAVSRSKHAPGQSLSGALIDASPGNDSRLGQRSRGRVSDPRDATRPTTIAAPVNGGFRFVATGVYAQRGSPPRRRSRRYDCHANAVD